MSRIKNDRLLRAIRHEPLDMTPVWIMRQAGRYLPEYRAVRERAGSFMNLCKTPELACEVTLQPLARYALDAAIIFSDILTIPDAMGLGLQFIEGKGPHFSHPLRTPKDIQNLRIPQKDQLDYVYSAIRLVQKELAGKVPLIGFCGSPWTLAAYMIEGRSQPGFPTVNKMQTSDPALLHNLLGTLASSVCMHLNSQIEAGVDVVMLFDSWGGILDTPAYETFSLQYIKNIISALDNSQHTPVILFTRGGGQWLEKMADTHCDVLGIDWETSMFEARQRVGKKVALQGNLNPATLLESPATIRESVFEVIDSYGYGSGHIFNLGHGITPDVPPEHVSVLVDAVHEFSMPYHVPANATGQICN